MYARVVARRRRGKNIPLYNFSQKSNFYRKNATSVGKSKNLRRKNSKKAARIVFLG
jgi:hypothetical protein